MKKLLLFFIITLLPVLGNAQTLIDGIYYNLNSSDNTASVTNNSNGYYSGRIIIPEKVIFGGATYSVTSIGNNAFKNCANLTNVSISNSVTSIGNGAFGMTSLRTLIVGAGVQQFDKSAFSGAAQPIKTIWFTNTPPQNYSVAQGKINYVANSQYGSLNNKIEYKYLSSLFNVDGVTYVPVSPSERTCDAIDFNNDESISFVNIDENVSYQGINMKVLSVQPYTFYKNNSLQKINLDIEGSIGKHAFDGCANLQTVELGNDILIIDEYAFNECSKLESIIVPDSVKEIHQYAFYGCSNMMSVTIGDGTKTIGKYAFSGCSNLNSAVIGNGVHTIEDYAFSECSSLNSVIIGNNTRFIQQYAFSGCTSLPKITIPGSVHIINDFAFERCHSLKEVVMNEKMNSEVETRTFEDVEVVVFQAYEEKIVLELFVSENDKLSFDYKFKNMHCVLHIKTPSGTTYIRYNQNTYGAGNYTKIFDKPSLLTITLYYLNTGYGSQSCTVKNIQLTRSDILGLVSNNTKSMFADCPLDSVCINRKISYSLSPFCNNATLRSAVITGKEEKISPSEFFGCTNLQNVLIGNGVTTIGEWAFSGCSALKSFSFGTNVNNIGKEAFSDCTAMTELISHSTTPPICGDQALDDINKWTCKLFVPKGCIGAYQAADQWKEFFFIEEGEKPKEEIAINEENFPDENFRAYLMSQSYGKDGIITEEEIKNVVRIEVAEKKITNLKGIEYFTALTNLFCGDNPLTSLDVSKNTALTTLYCNNNQLTSLDVSKNTALTGLYCNVNKLTSLDVSKNTALTRLGCYDNQLTSLDVSKNTALTSLLCYSNKLMSLDVSKNTALTGLYCNVNKLTSLDVSKNTALTTLYCHNNQLTNLDVSKNTTLARLVCNNNQLTSLDVSKNTALTELYCYDNKIKGEAMDALVGSLPNQASAKIRVIDLSNSSEENVCTTIQVNTAKEKGWRVLTSSGVDYEGCGPVVVQGDANYDGIVDANDIANIVNYMMGKPISAGMFDVQAADMNKDGVVNIADIVQILNNIMGK